MKTVLYFTDAHVEPDTNLDRFEALGYYIVDKKPDVIVQGGDFSSMLSLSHWDMDKRKIMEHRRYSKDMFVSNLALWKMLDPLTKEQQRLSNNKKKNYLPDIIWLEGNHEYWVEKYCQYNPAMDGAISYRNDLDLPDGTQYVPYRSDTENSVAIVEGVAFTHAPRNRAGIISSKYLADRAVSEAFTTSVVFGHTHRLQTSSIARTDNTGNLRLLRSINGGCFFEDNPAYSKQNSNDYWKGFLLLECDDGEVNVLEEMTIKRLKENYL